MQVAVMVKEPVLEVTGLIILNYPSGLDSLLKLLLLAIVL